MEVRPGYTQTEVGVIPEDWAVLNLSEICSSIKTGKLDANAMKSDGEYRFYTCAKNHYWIDKYAFDAEALLVSGNGANVGYVHYYYGKFNAYQRTYVLTDFSQSILFLKIYLERNLAERIRVEVNAGNTPYITMDTLTDMKIGLPLDKFEQSAIATALSDVDTLIASLDKLITKKRAIKTATMQQLLTGNKRLPGFSGEWEVKRLGNIAPLQRGFDLPNPLLKKGIYPVVYSNGILNHHDAFQVKGPGVITGRSGTIGKVSFVEDNYWPHNTTLWVTSFNNNDPKFIFYLYNRLGLERFATGSGVPTLNRNDVHMCEVLMPSSTNEQTAIATVLSDMDAEITALEARRDKTIAIKQGMMQELLTGRTRLI